MAAIDFPASPTNGQTFTSGNKTWVYSTTISAWDLQPQINTVPVGSIIAYGGATAPTGWLLCDGTSTTGYTALAALVGATTPNMQGRFPIGDNGALALLATGGSLTIGLNNLPAHSHPNTATASTSVSLTDPTHNHGGVTGAEGAHVHDDVREGSVTTHNHNNDGTAGSINTGGTTPTGSDLTGAGSNHTHSISGASTGISVSSATTTVTMSNANNTTTASDYYQPYFVVNFIIKHD